jgi:hypothetical protein
MYLMSVILKQIKHPYKINTWSLGYFTTLSELHMLYSIKLDVNEWSVGTDVCRVNRDLFQDMEALRKITKT